MGNNHSSENPDVYTYHETVLKQGAQAAGSDESDESDDEMQEGYSREAPTSNNVEIETNSNSSGEENSDSEEKSTDISNSDVENPEQTSFDQSELVEASEDIETENEAVAPSSSTAPKHAFEHENAEFVTPPSSPSSPGSRRSTRLQLKTSTINTISKKRPRLSMRDSDDSDDDSQYITPPAIRKTTNRPSNIAVISHRSSSKNQAENRSEDRAEVQKTSDEANITPESPSSSNQSETSVVRTGTPPSHEISRPNLRSSGGEGRPFLRAKRSVQIFGKNAVHLQKVVSIPPTNEQYTGEVNVDVPVLKTANDESILCTNPTENDLDSEKVSSVTKSATSTESDRTPQQPVIAPSEGSTAICTTTSNSLLNDTHTVITTVAFTQNNLISETSQDQSPVNAVTSNSNDNVISTSTTVSNQTPSEARSGGDDVIMRDVNSEKESNTSRTNMDSEKFSASETNTFQPMDTQSVENSINDITIPKTLEFVTVNGEHSQNGSLVFGSRNFMSSTEDLQPSQSNTTGGLLSFSQLANSQTAAPSITTPSLSCVTAPSSALMLYPHSQPQTSGLSQIHTPAPSTSTVASSSQISRPSQNGCTSHIHTPISPPVINQKPKLANHVPLSPSSTLLSVQKCCIFPISSNFEMIIRQGDIIKQDAAAIVNSTDIHLRHQGAVSRLVAEAASPQMMVECQQHLMNHGGSLNILHVMDTIAGGRLNTNVERIIHVIPPSGSSTHFDHLSVNKLVSAYLQCMLHSDRILQSTSLAFPLLGAGSFPTDISINAFYNAVLIFLSDKRSLSRLNDIRLIINEPQIYQFAVDYFISCYENILTQGIDSAVAEALDGFYGNRNSSLSSFCVKDEVDGNHSNNKKWSATASLRNLFRGPAVKRPRL